MNKSPAKLWNSASLKGEVGMHQQTIVAHNAFPLIRFFDLEEDERKTKARKLMRNRSAFGYGVWG